MAATEETQTTPQNEHMQTIDETQHANEAKATDDAIGDWVKNVVGLQQYKEGFKLLGHASLQSISLLESVSFEKDIRELMVHVDKGAKLEHSGHASKFKQAHNDLKARFQTQSGM